MAIVQISLIKSWYSSVLHKKRHLIFQCFLYSSKSFLRTLPSWHHLPQYRQAFFSVKLTVCICLCKLICLHSHLYRWFGCSLQFIGIYLYIAFSMFVRAFCIILCSSETLTLYIMVEIWYFIPHITKWCFTPDVLSDFICFCFFRDFSHYWWDRITASNFTDMVCVCTHGCI